MKKNLFILIVLALLTISLSNCSKPPEPSDAIIQKEVETQFSTIELHREIVKIQRGEPLVNQNVEEIPQGTELYPVMITLHIKGPDGEGDMSGELYFYKDVYGNWKSMEKSE